MAASVQNLSTELFKVKENLSNTIMNDIFSTRALNYNLRSQADFFRNAVNTTRFGFNSLRYFASTVWSMVPIETKNSSSVEIFKNAVSGSLTIVTAAFVKITCVELDMLTWLITNPFVASLDTGHLGSQESFHI